VVGHIIRLCARVHGLSGRSPQLSRVETTKWLVTLQAPTQSWHQQASQHKYKLRTPDQFSHGCRLVKSFVRPHPKNNIVSRSYSRIEITVWSKQFIVKDDPIGKSLPVLGIYSCHEKAYFLYQLHLLLLIGKYYNFHTWKLVEWVVLKSKKNVEVFLLFSTTYLSIKWLLIINIDVD